MMIANMRCCRLLLALILVETCLGADAEVMISNVKAEPISPWGKVFLQYEVSGVIPTNANEYALSVAASNRMTGVVTHAKMLSGNTGLTLGKHSIVWDLSAQSLDFGNQEVNFLVSYHPTLYMVISLTGGTSAKTYQISWLDQMPIGGWSDDYRWNKIVLRRIDAGRFVMGSPEDELGRSSDEIQHQVTLTRSYYIGVFEVTIMQWYLVMGSGLGYGDYSSAVTRVSYDMIRGSKAGAEWPASSRVDADSFMGILRAKTGIDFDLPTEAQWEYACRAGTTTALNSGKNLTSSDKCSNMAEVGRYWYNSGGYWCGTCGDYEPNAWGLYDMHGNVEELCLDWFGTYLGDCTDPKGAAAGRQRVHRGGDMCSWASGCRSAERGGSNIYSPSSSSGYMGFRLSCLKDFSR